MTTAPTAPHVDFDDLPGALAALRRAGGRATTARRVLLEALFAADGLVSAEQIADGLGGRVTPSDLASTYRNLETLQQHGLVRHVHLGHGPGLWALAGGREREYLVCERCGATQAISPAVLATVRELLHAESGFDASFAHFAIVGLCQDCATGDAHDPQAASGGPARLDL